MAQLWVDLDILKARIGLTDCSNDTVLTSIILGVQSSISGYTQSPILQVQRDYWIGGSGTTEAVLPERPVYIGDVEDLHVYVVNEPYLTPTADDELTYQVDFDFGGNDDPIAGHDYRWEGTLQRVDGSVWPPAWRRLPTRLSSAVDQFPRVIRIIDVNVGWLPQDIPAAITEAAYMEAAVRFATRKTGFGPYQSESWNGYSYTIAMLQNMDQYGAPRFASPIATELLAPYGAASIAAMR